MEADLRLQKFGYNEMKPPKGTPEWLKFLHEVTYLIIF